MLAMPGCVAGRDVVEGIEGGSGLWGHITCLSVLPPWLTLGSQPGKLSKPTSSLLKLRSPPPSKTLSVSFLLNTLSPIVLTQN